MANFRYTNFWAARVRVAVVVVAVVAVAVVAVAVVAVVAVAVAAVAAVVVEAVIGVIYRILRSRQAWSSITRRNIPLLLALGYGK